MKIRPYVVGDQYAVIDLWQSCDLTMPWNDPIKDIARKLSVDPERFLVGEIDDHVIASIMIGYDGHRGWINYLAVSEPHRRRGYGAQLMARAESMLRQTGCPKINLQLRTSNPTAINFYNALGYLEDQVLSVGKRLNDD
jgi:ribosomal protein S18 acetylase RimI-like enzyme